MVLDSGSFGTCVKYLSHRGKNKAVSRQLGSVDLPSGRKIAEEALMGTGNKIKNKTDKLVGKGKKAIGDATGNKSLKAKGRKQQAKGSLKQTGEKAKDAFKGK